MEYKTQYKTQYKTKKLAVALENIVKKINGMHGLKSAILANFRKWADWLD